MNSIQQFYQDCLLKFALMGYFPTLSNSSSIRTITAAYAYCNGLYDMRMKDIRVSLATKSFDYRRYYLNVQKKRKISKRNPKIDKIYKKTTAEITDEMAMNMLDTDMRNDYLALLNIADHSHIGKPRAILTAFKLGYLQGKSAHEPDMHDLDFQNVISEAALKLEKASIVLRTTIEANSLSKTDLTRDEMVAIGGCASNICDMMVVADDYVYHAQKELEGILE